MTPADPSFAVESAMRTAAVLADAPLLQSGTSFLDGLGQFLRPETLVSVLVEGLAKSAIYVMIAGGLTLIFGLMGVLNFAHGTLTMLGAYIAGIVMVLVVGSATGQVGRMLAFFGALAVVFLLVGGFGSVIEVGLIRKLYDRPPIAQILLTFGVALVLEEATRIVVLFYGLQPTSEWQEAFGTKPAALAARHTIGPLSIRGLALFEILMGALTVAGIWLFLTRTRYGLFIRAGSEDAEMAEALGIDVRRVFTVVFALGAGIAGIAGAVLMWDQIWGANVPLAAETLLPAFVVVIIGGLGTFRGTVAGALIVGMVDAVTTWWFINVVTWTWLPDVAVFLILVGMLILKPQGLFGVEEVGGH